VLNQNLARDYGRWPRFGPVALEAGFRSVHAIPMRLRGATIGALNLFRDHEGLLDEADVSAAQALADVATIGILQHRAAIQAHLVVDQLNHALHSRVMIEQAKGVLAERTHLDMNAAFSWLRNHARSHNLLLVDVAQSVVDGTLSPAPPR
jgi:GAF domain-containing protein